MNSTARNIFAVIVGLIVGGVINFALVNLGPRVIPLPEDAAVSTMEELQESIKLFKPANFLFPFLAHALGTLVAAFVAAKLAASHGLSLGLLIGAVFLLAGTYMIAMVGGPLWFCLADLILAYIPMGYLGATFAGVKSPPRI